MRSSRWTLPTMKNWNVPLVIPTDMRSVTVPPPARSRPTRSSVALHLPGRPAGALLVAGAVEQQQQRVAAPLEQAGAVVVRLVEQRGEHAVERVAHQLGADLALACETLREGREPRDVDEHHRAVDLALQRVRRVSEPVDDEPRDVRRQSTVLARARARGDGRLVITCAERCRPDVTGPRSRRRNPVTQRWPCTGRPPRHVGSLGRGGARRS